MSEQMSPEQVLGKTWDINWCGGC